MIGVLRADTPAQVSFAPAATAPKTGFLPGDHPFSSSSKVLLSTRASTGLELTRPAGDTSAEKTEGEATAASTKGVSRAWSNSGDDSPRGAFLRLFEHDNGSPQFASSPSSPASVPRSSWGSCCASWWSDPGDAMAIEACVRGKGVEGAAMKSNRSSESHVVFFLKN